MLAVIKTVIVEDMIAGDVSRNQARERLDGVIEEQVNINLLLEFQSKNKRHSWGATGTDAAVNLVGGPAGPPPE